MQQKVTAAAGAIALGVLCAFQTPVQQPPVELAFSFSELQLEPEFTCRPDIPDGRPLPDVVTGRYRLYYIGEVASNPILPTQTRNLYRILHPDCGCSFYFLRGAAPPYDGRMLPFDAAMIRTLPQIRSEAARSALVEIAPSHLQRCIDTAFETGHIDDSSTDSACLIELEDILIENSLILGTDAYSTPFTIYTILPGSVFAL